MKVDRFQGYSLGARNLNHAKNQSGTIAASVSDNVSFGGFIPKLKLGESARTFIDYFPEGEAKACRVMTRVKDFAEGEAAGIGITAIGTGLVAPWPIAYNPIVDYKLKKNNATPEEIEEKHKTQKYSAWRQPVSAVLAVIFQLGVQKPIQICLDNWTNNPDYAHKFNGTIYNQAFLNNDKYLERQIKKDLTKGGILGFFRKPDEEKIKEIEITEFSVDETGKKIETKRPAKTLEEAVKQEKTNRTNAQIDEIVKALKGIKKTDTEIKVGEHIVPTRALAESVNYQIEDYIKFAKGLLKNHLQDYVEKAQQIINNKDIIKTVLAPDNIEQNVARILEENPKLGGNRPAAIREFINEQRTLFEKEGNSDMVKVLDRILGKCDKVIESSCARTVNRIEKILKACDGKFTPGAYFEFMHSKRNVIVNEKIDKLQRLIIPEEELATIKPFELQQKIKDIKAACHYDGKDKVATKVFKDKGIFLSNGDTLLENVYRNVIEKGYKEVVKHKNKISSQIVKACIATFIMLPITCTALNWVYPRFMDIFLPGLSGKKNAKPQGNGGVA